jgi:hypothetical protein
MDGFIDALQVAKLEAENKALNDAKPKKIIANFFNSMFKM